MAVGDLHYQWKRLGNVSHAFPIWHMPDNPSKLAICGLFQDHERDDTPTDGGPVECRECRKRVNETERADKVASARMWAR